MNIPAHLRLLLLSLALLLSFNLTGCTGVVPLLLGLSAPLPADPPPAITAAAACPVTEPLWLEPPDDPAVLNDPAPGYYYVNEDRSIWASAWWTGREETYLRAGDEGIKVGWFRPAGAPLTITGMRVDGEAPPLHAHVSCCYPTRFQASGLVFPSEGCWQVTAEAAESTLSFTVRVAP